MKLKNDYIFRSERLGFRNWIKNDLPEFATMNADSEVMQHFPNPLTEIETAELIDRLERHYEVNGFTYFATELLETGELIGFIGLALQDYKSDFTPAVDIGWRLKKSVWGNGYATEGARKCLDFAFNKLNLTRVIATCAVKNTKSENVMIKLGMEKVGTFKHPKLKAFPDYERCICYEIKNAR
jgi:RimJ/RimL family protein N-acetyltransferase